MKKTVIFATLVTSILSVASTTGSVEFKLKNSNNYDIYQKDIKKFGKVENKISEASLKSEVKLKDTGLSFGTELKGKDIKLPLNSDSKVGSNVLNNSSVFVKYELPEVNKVNSNVGLTVKKTNATLKGGINTKIDNTTYGADFTQVIPYKLDRNKAYLTSKLYLNNDNVNASLEVKNNYGKYAYGKYKWNNQPVATGTLFSPIEHIYVKLNGNKKIDDVKLYFNGDLRYQFNENNLIFKDYLTEQNDIFISYTANKTTPIHKLYQGYRLGAEYTKNNIILDTNVFLQNVYKSEINGNDRGSVLNNRPKVEVRTGVKLATKYKGIKNLELSSNIRAGYMYEKDVYYKKTKPATELEIINNHYGYVALGIGAKYDIHATDKLTITPELNAEISLDRINLKKENPRKYHNGENDESRNLLQLSIDPKIQAKYKASDNLEIIAKLEAGISFSNKKYKPNKNGYKGVWGEYGTEPIKNFRFNSINPKAELNIKYVW